MMSVFWSWEDRNGNLCFMISLNSTLALIYQIPDSTGAENILSKRLVLKHGRAFDFWGPKFLYSFIPILQQKQKRKLKNPSKQVKLRLQRPAAR